MNTHVEFKSDQFPPYEGEDEAVNPGRYGKRLAEYIVNGLRSEGVSVEEPVSEDWGWVVTVENATFPLWIGCGNYEEYEDGFLCFIEPSKPMIRRFFKRIDTTETISALRDALDHVLRANPAIRDIRWWTQEEFNHPRA
jgi:hypothetical protein